MRWRRSSSIPIGTCPTPSRTRRSRPIWDRAAASSAAAGIPSVLRRHNLRIKYGNRDVDPDQIDWSRNDIRNFDLVQPPGPGNVLGRVKFVFPNSHDVYMHDTTQKFLFNNAVRAESHGCMRVQNPNLLAQVLLEEGQGLERGSRRIDVRCRRRQSRGARPEDSGLHHLFHAAGERGRLVLVVQRSLRTRLAG